MENIKKYKTTVNHVECSGKTIIDDKYISVSITDWPSGEGITVNFYGCSDKENVNVEVCSEGIDLLKKCLEQ